MRKLTKVFMDELLKAVKILQKKVLKMESKFTLASVLQIHQTISNCTI